MVTTRRPILKGRGGSKDKEETRSKKKHDKPNLTNSTPIVGENALVIKEGTTSEPPTKKRKSNLVGKGTASMTPEANTSKESQAKDTTALVPTDRPLTSDPIDNSIWEGRFISENAYRIYMAYSTKQIMPEHPLNVYACERSCPSVLENIKNRGWEHFAKGPQIQANVTAVRELYANWDPQKGNIVMVRGRKVDISARAINAYYGVSQEEPVDYNALVKDPAFDDILHVLCGHPSASAQVGNNSRIAWGSNTNTPYATIKKEIMIKKARIWHNWVCNRFMQAEHQSKVIRARVLLVYALMKGIFLNLGELLHEQMRRTRDHMQWKLYFVHTLSALLQKHKVPTYRDDELRDIPPEHDITHVKNPKGNNSDIKSHGERLQSVEAELCKLREEQERHATLLATQLEARDALMMSQLTQFFASTQSTRSTRSIGTQTDCEVVTEIVALSATDGTDPVEHAMEDVREIFPTVEGAMIDAVDASDATLVDPSSEEAVVLSRSHTLPESSD